MATSKLQNYLSRRLHTETYLEVKENYRPPWLSGLELDFYIDQYRIAIEVQGEQHVRRVPLFHKTDKDFDNQVSRDALKRRICLQQDIRLLYVFDQTDADTAFLEVKHADKIQLYIQRQLRELAFLYAASLLEDLTEQFLAHAALYEKHSLLIRDHQPNRKKHKKITEDAARGMTDIQSLYRQHFEAHQQVFLNEATPLVRPGLLDEARRFLKSTKNLDFDPFMLFCGRGQIYIDEPIY